MTAVRQKDFETTEQPKALRDVPTAVSPLLSGNWSARGAQTQVAPDVHPDDAYDPEVDPWPILVPSPTLSDDWSQAEGDDRLTGLLPSTLRPDMSTGVGAGPGRHGSQKVHADVYAQRIAIEAQAGISHQSAVEEDMNAVFARVTLSQAQSPAPQPVPQIVAGFPIKLLNFAD